MEEYLSTAVIQWMKQITDKNIIVGWQDIERPALPYFEIHLVTTNPLRDQATEHEYLPTGVQRADRKAVYEDTIDRDYEYVISINGYGEETHRDLRRMSAITQDDLGELTPPLFRDGRFVVVDLGIIARIVEEVKSRWEPRYITEMILHEFFVSEVINPDADIVEEAPFTVERTC